MSIAVASETPTIKVEHIQPGMVIDFQQFPGLRGAGDEASLHFVGEAEVISVEEPDGLGDEFGLYVSPEDGSTAEVYVQAYGWQSYPIAG